MSGVQINVDGGTIASTIHIAGDHLFHDSIYKWLLHNIHDVIYEWRIHRYKENNFRMIAMERFLWVIYILMYVADLNYKYTSVCYSYRKEYILLYWFLILLYWFLNFFATVLHWCVVKYLNLMTSMSTQYRGRISSRLSSNSEAFARN